MSNEIKVLVPVTSSGVRTEVTRTVGESLTFRILYLSSSPGEDIFIAINAKANRCGDNLLG